jgi:UDP-N-acetylglucosamine diphosphorylase/glucosamine-1-phosphate N-acetyltransferase
MSFTLFEDVCHFDLLPFTFTRPAYDLRSGIFTFRERWEHSLGKPVNSLAYDYLRAGFDQMPDLSETTFINGRFVPDEDLLRLIPATAPGSFFVNEREEVLTARFSPDQFPQGHDGLISRPLLLDMGLREEKTAVNARALRFPPDIFRMNRQLIEFDFEWVLRNEQRDKIRDPHTRMYGEDNLFVAPGVRVRAAIINAEDGPVYLGREVHVQEGAIIRGAHAFCEKAVVSVGAKLRGDTTVGPHCKAGGEITNSVMMGFSNKGHDGYLGNSVLGYWCNIGADTNASNLKNNYSHVRIWNYRQERFVDTGDIFCGLMMGDHSKCGINTMFNTGTVVGVAANIFGAGIPRSFIPSFSWGGAAGFTTHQLHKVFEVAEHMMVRRGLKLEDTEKEILAAVKARTQGYRLWERQGHGAEKNL